MSDRRDGRRDLDDTYADAGVQLGMQVAEQAFARATSKPLWSVEDVEAETDRALGQMEITARDTHAAWGLDLDEPECREVWNEVEQGCYARMDELLRVSGLWSGGKLQ
jgi:hypothetical protein